MREIFQDRKHPVFKRYLALLLSFVMVMSSMTFTMAVDETEYLSIYNFTLQIKNANGEWVIPEDGVTEVENGQEIRLLFDWSISDTNAMDEFEVVFPMANMILDSYGTPDAPLSLPDTAGQIVGTYYVENGSFHIKLNDYGISQGHLVGQDAMFEGIISAQSKDENGKAEIGIIGSSAFYTLPIDLKIPGSMVYMAKSAGAVTVKEDGIYQTFTINAQASGNSSDVVIYDIPGSGIAIDNSTIQIDIDGEDYTASKGAANGFPITVGTLNDGQRVTVTYSAKIDEAILQDNVYQTDKYDNMTYATFTNNENVPDNKTSEHTVKASVAKPSVSKGGAIADDNSSVRWTITITTGDLNADDLADISIADVLGENLSYNGSLNLNALTLADFTKQDDGSYVLTYETSVDSEVAGSSASVSLSNDVSFSYTYNGKPCNSSVTGSVSTSGKSVLNKVGYYNEAEDVFEWTVTVNVPEEGMTKLNVKDDFAGGLTHSLVNGSINVQTANKSYTLPEFEINAWGGSTPISDDSNAITAEAYYMLHGFALDFTEECLDGLAGTTIKVTYKTYASLDSSLDKSTIIKDPVHSLINVNGSSYTPETFYYRNVANVSYISNGEEGTESFTEEIRPCGDWMQVLTKVGNVSDDIIEREYKEAYNISTIGTTSTVWSMFVNFDKITDYAVGDVITITDTLPENMMLHYSTDYRDAVIIDTAYQPTWDTSSFTVTEVHSYDALREALSVNVSEDGRTVTFSVAVTDEVIAYVENMDLSGYNRDYAYLGLYIAYVTDVLDEADLALSDTAVSYKNEATSTYTSAGITVPSGYDDAVSSLSPKTLLDKSGKWDSNSAQYAEYTVLVNEGAYQLSGDGSTITVVDKLGAALQYDISSIKVEEYKTETASWSELNHSKYSYALSKTNQTNDTLTFNLPDGMYLRITYTVNITESTSNLTDANASNAVEIAGFGMSETASSSSSIVSQITGGVVASAAVSSIKLIKYSVLNGTAIKYLNGAEFTLTPVYYENDVYKEYSEAEITANPNWKPTVVVVAEEGTTVSGLLFNQVYRLSETKAPAGYQTMEDVYFYIPHAISQGEGISVVPDTPRSEDTVKYSDLVVNIVAVEDEPLPTETPTPTPTETPVPTPTETPVPTPTGTPVPTPTETPVPTPTETPVPTPTETPVPTPTETPVPTPTETPVPTPTETPIPTPTETPVPTPTETPVPTPTETPVPTPTETPVPTPTETPVPTPTETPVPTPTETPVPTPTETPVPTPTETPVPTPTETPVPTPTETPVPTPTETPVPTPTETPVPTPTETPVPTPTETPVPTPTPVLTTQIKVHKVDAEDNVISGVTFGIYSGAACGEDDLKETIVTDSNGDAVSTQEYPAGTYYLKELSGPDNVILLDNVYKITVTQNTLEISIDIEGDDKVSITNSIIKVINITVTPTPTETPVPTPTETPVPTPTETPVPTPTETPVPTPTETPVPTPTETPVPTPTETPVPTPTETPVPTPTETPVPTPTETPVPTPTETPVPTPTETPVPTPTETPVPTPTETPVPTPTETPVPTPTETPVPTPTETPVPTPTETPVPTPTETPVPTPTETPVPTPTETPVPTPTETPVPTPVETSVKISKVDIADGEELPGATIQILDAAGNVVEEWVSTNEPKEIKGLKTGVEYTLREIVAPDGYDIATDTRFVLDENGAVDKTKTTTTVSEEGVLLVEDSRIPEETTPDNPTTPEEKGSLVVEVLDEETNEPVEGAVVRITGPDGTSVELVTNKQGKVFGDFVEGQYKIEVISVPEGYTVTTGKVTTVTVVANQTAEHTAEISKRNGGQLGDDESGHLPITGMLVWPITVLSIMGALLTVIGAYDNRRRKSAE